MRFARIDHTDGPRVCAVDEDGAARAVSFSDTGAPVRTLQEVIAAGAEAADRLSIAATAEPGKVLAPLVPHRNIFCVGKNYRDHVAEFGRSGYDSPSRSEDLPDRPIVFSKATTSVVGPGARIDPHSGVTRELDYEGELCVIIGPGGRGISRDQAYDHVWGYTIVNDVTARDVQRDHKQWLLGKSLDTHCPMGPYAVTADEIADVAALRVETTVNGEPRQGAPVKDLIFDVPELIATISAGISLLPGDLIATGTPAGVGIGFDPPKFLTSGDVVEVTITGLGTLSNHVG